MFAGPLKHAGFPITSGIRNILVLFLYVEGFHYGPLLRDYINKHPSGQGGGQEQGQEEGHEHGQGEGEGKDTEIEIECRDRDNTDRTYSGNDSTDDPRSSGAAKGGFVVYRQTVELVSMLEETETGIETETETGTETETEKEIGTGIETETEIEEVSV